MLPCGDCKAVYIGETSRQMKIKVDEHKKAWEKGKEEILAFADHIITSGHGFREGSVALLHKENSYFKRTALEHIEIIRHKNTGGVVVLNRYIPDEDLIELVYESQLDD